MVGVPKTMYCCIYIYNLYTCHNGRCANDHVLLYIYIYIIYTRATMVGVPMTMYCCIYIYIIYTRATMVGVPMTMYCCIYIYNLYTCHNGRCANDHVLLYIYI